MQLGINLYQVDYLIRTINNAYPDKQIGRTLFQKLIFLYSREIGKDLKYEMYHYGPYSYLVSNLLEIAEKEGIVDVKWNGDGGYSIQSRKTYEKPLDPKDQKTIDKVITLYGKFNVQEISIIATAYYLLDHFNIEMKNLVSEVKKVKPKFAENYIKKLLLEVKLGV